VHQSLAARSDLEPEQHTVDILDGIGEAFFGLDRDWRIVYFNSACESFFERSREKAIGRVVWELYPETRGTEFERRYREAMSERMTISFETESAVRPGHWLEVRAFPTRQGLGVAFRDISERRRADEELRYQLDLTRAITDNTAEALFLMDDKGRVSFANPAAERMFGFTAEEMMGHVLHDLIHHRHPDGRPFPISDCPLGAVFSLGTGVRVHDDVFFAKDGSPVDVSCSNTPVFKDGRIVGAALVVRDVTERKRREAALRESEARFRHMADSAPALIWMTGADGQVTFANLHYDYMFGRPATEMLGAGWSQIIVPEDVGAFEEAFAEAFRDRQAFRCEVRVRDKEQRVRWLRCEGVPRLDDRGTFLGYTGCNVDITDAKSAEEQQRLLINELNHRVKNTLATVQSITAQTLRNAASPDKARRDVEERLIALSRAHDVLTRENWEGANLRAVVAQAVEPYRAQRVERFRTAGPDVRLSPRMTLALAMALQELATNAVKYGALSNEDGCIAIEWSIEPGEPRRLRLTWTESGGPGVVAPRRRGFGSRLIERSLAQDLDGNVLISFDPGGVVCTIEAPLEP
jgi:PAS domain S-box-containing protein